MAVRYRTRGFILKKEDFGEAGQIFILYTKDFGKIKVLGRGIRKIKSKLRAGTELFSLSEIEFIQGKIYKTLTDAIIIEKFKNVRNDLEKLKIAYQIAENVDDLIRGEEKDEDIFNLLNEAFQKLENYELRSNPTGSPSEDVQKNYELIYYYFVWNLLSILGYQVNLYKCSSCQKKLAPRELYFEPKEGGIICSDCFNKNKKGIEISPEIIKILRLFIKKDWQTVMKLKISDNYKNSLEVISEEYLKNLVF